MDYREAMNFLEETKKYGSIPGLDSIRALMKELGNVQDTLPVIHLAGTNGKGSVGAMLESVYRAAGYRTGRFSTPDVFSYEEEFMVDGKPISREELADIFTAVKEACAQAQKITGAHPTRFEVETAAAFLWVKQKNVDVALIETGMGGELDATNLISHPSACVITSVSMDHMRFLGNTLNEIARAKAGIMKHGCVTVSSWQQEEVQNVLRDRAKQTESELVFADERKMKVISEKEEGICFSYGGLENLLVSLHGKFQIQNAACAVETIQALQNRFPVEETALRKGLASVRWPGRFEKISSDPAFYIDGAHNRDAAFKLRETLDNGFTDKQIVYIMGVLRDKEYEEIAGIMFCPGDIVFTVTPDSPRAMDASVLAETLRKRGIRARATGSIGQAAAEAARACPEDGMILAFGSLSYLREVKEICAEHRKEGA